MKRATGNIVVLAVTVCLCLIAAEITFRLVDGYRLDKVELVTVLRQENGPADNTLAYAKRLGLEPTFNVSWYTTDPHDYDRSNTYRLPPDWVKAYADYRPTPGEPAFVKSELRFLYNYNWLVEACTKNVHTKWLEYYKRDPGFLYAFASPDASTEPQYRIVPRGWNEGYNSYNNFGFRGPDINPYKSARTIRVAFVGASYEVQGWPYSYPEYAVHFLKLWAKANNYDVDFDLINAGRTGFDSLGISKILRYEVAPLHPDIVIYDPGANDLTTDAYVKMQISSQASAPRADAMPLPLEQYSAFLDRVYELIFRRGGPSAEPPKPAHSLTFDFSQNPNLDQPGLPFRLRGQIADIQDAASAVRSIHGQLFLSSPLSVMHAGLRLDPERDRLITDMLDRKYWPLTYGEFREAFDFENRAYRELAQSDGYSFLDVSKYFPEDPNLFSDLFHFRTENGERLEGWIVAQLLAPYIRDAIQKHQLPKPAFKPDPKSIAWATAPPIKFNLACLPPLSARR